MSDFFSGIHGARFPDVAMNTGPLPPANGLPAPLHDTPDGRINYASTLLGDLNPYAYGEPGTMSSDQSYQNHPHRMHKCVPMIYLPEPTDNTVFGLSHPVDDSDIAIVLKLDRRSIFASGTRSTHSTGAKGMDAFDNFINLPTLNYILAGLQLADLRGDDVWKQLLVAIDPDRFQGTTNTLYLSDIVHIVQNRIFPFGIVRGSEKQGGQNETGSSPATWPVGFIAAMVIDGKDRNISNIWHHVPVDAGDDLILRLDARPVTECQHYTLNHYYKSMQKRGMAQMPSAKAAAARGVVVPPLHVWQLVPDKFTMSTRAPQAGRSRDTRSSCVLIRDPATPRVPPLIKFPHKLNEWARPVGAAPATTLSEVYWQHLGYWHIARSQVAIGQYGENDSYFNDTSHAMYVNHLEVTFSPTWCAIPAPRSLHTTRAGAITMHKTRGAILGEEAHIPSHETEEKDDPLAGVTLGRRMLDAAFEDTRAKRGRGADLAPAAPVEVDAPTVSSMDVDAPAPEQPRPPLMAVDPSLVQEGTTLGTSAPPSGEPLPPPQRTLANSFSRKGANAQARGKQSE